MISEEQMERAEMEFAANALAAFEVARDAERALERYSYPRTVEEKCRYSLDRIAALRQEFEEADYMAESRAWILHLIKKDRARLAAMLAQRDAGPTIKDTP